MFVGLPSATNGLKQLEGRSQVGRGRISSNISDALFISGQKVLQQDLDLQHRQLY
jgi:hypothetical protein